MRGIKAGVAVNKSPSDSTKKEKQNGKEDSEERQEAGKREAVDEATGRQALVGQISSYEKGAAPDGAAAPFLFILAFFRSC